jgi:SpoVK/Ycf46/Vps4 family AAA+-type ATPase
MVGYMANYLRKRALLQGGDYPRWFELIERTEGLSPETLDGYAELTALNAEPGKKPAAARIRQAFDTFLSELEKRHLGLCRAPLSIREKNLRTLSRMLGLDRIDHAVFGFYLRYHVSTAFENFIDHLTGFGETNRAIPDMLGITQQEFVSRLNRGGTLSAKGLLHLNREERDCLTSRAITIPELLCEAIDGADGSVAGIRRHVLGKPCEASLEWDDFAHLGDVRDRLRTFLARAVRDRLTGINILLWGPPGTGKTEFAKVLAGRAGLPLHAVGESDDKGKEPNREVRIEALRLHQHLARRMDRTLLLFDEMEDAFAAPGMPFGGGRGGSSKVFTNRLLESNPVPVIWIVNNPGLMEESLIRRMGFALEMKMPPLAAREKVWERILARQGVRLDRAEVHDLARQEEISPAVVESAVRFGRLSGGSVDDIRDAAWSIVKAMTGRNRRADGEAVRPFDAALANPDLDIERLVRQLADWRTGGGAADPVGDSSSRAFSLCLYGPPGTGKSAFVRHLAERLGLEVTLKRASDLLGPYVGQTEQKIAEAFTRARDDGRFLVFDEADSFLGDRRRATRSWEVSHVNEMLTWMENHPLPFACTTNLMEILDEASLRRFTFKVRFDFLSPGQVEAAFRFFFGTEAPPQARTLCHLTPGDFAVARRKAALMGLRGQADDLAALLAAEVAVKRLPPATPIGFSAA